MAKFHIPKPSEPGESLCSFNLRWGDNDSSILFLDDDWEEKKIDLKSMCKYCVKRYKILNSTDTIPKKEQQVFAVKDIPW